jgi:hypothetical protein
MDLSVSTATIAGDAYTRTLPPYSACYDGRGIVTCAGGPVYRICAWVLIRMLRHLGCQLPIQVWCLNERELDEEWIFRVSRFDVECVNAENVQERCPHPRLNGWELKPYALLHSPFREVLLLDADNVPVVDPQFLFETAPYRETGAIFWPDGLRTPPGSPRWRIFGVEYRNEPEQESGQVAVDKQRCWTALNLCNWYNMHSDFYYQYVYGDKDTYRFAWHRVNQSYAMPLHPLVKEPGVLYQHDFHNRRIFQHRCLAKWSLSHNRRLSGFLWEDECLAWIEELRRGC